MGLVLAGHVVAYMVGAVVDGIAGELSLTTVKAVLTGAALAPGAVQLLWVVPLAVALGVTGRKRVLMGLLVTAGVIFLLNAACWGGLALFVTLTPW